MSVSYTVFPVFPVFPVRSSSSYMGIVLIVRNS
jgi:hypothetical protein